MLADKIKKVSCKSNGHINLLFVGGKDVTANKDLSKEIGLSVGEIQEIFSLYDCPCIEGDYVVDDKEKFSDIFKTMVDIAFEKDEKIEEFKEDIYELIGKDITIEVIKKDLYVATNIFKNLQVNHSGYSFQFGSKDEENQILTIGLAEVNGFKKEINKIELKMSEDFIVNIYFCIKLL